MMDLLNFSLDLLVAMVLIPVCVFFFQVLLAFPHYQPRPMPRSRRPGVAVLVPAHEEASGIAAALDSVRRQLTGADRLVVVADNCSDDTAAVAARAGAEVVERHDPARRGKGYALDCGVRYLERDPREIVIVMDADCHAMAGAIDRLARVSGQQRRPVQALYLMYCPAGARPTTRIAEFAWVVKNLVRPLGFFRLGLPCQLMGSGMAFPWALIRSTALKSGHLVEDMKLGIDLSFRGAPPMLCPEARVISRFPASAEGIRSQRTRWEHGHLGMIMASAPGLLKASFGCRDRRLLAMALDLCVPPLALLALTVFALFAGSLLLGLPTGRVLAGTALALLAGAVAMSWARYGRRLIPLRSLLMAPLYALWKIPFYLKFITARQVVWIRSRRGGN